MTEQIVAAPLADPALVRALVEAPVLGLTLPCQGVAADGLCPCSADPAPPPDFRTELRTLLTRWDARDRAAGKDMSA